MRRSSSGSRCCFVQPRCSWECRPRTAHRPCDQHISAGRMGLASDYCAGEALAKIESVASRLLRTPTQNGPDRQAVRQATLVLRFIVRWKALSHRRSRLSEIGVRARRNFLSSLPRKREPRDFKRLPWAPAFRGGGDNSRACAIELQLPSPGRQKGRCAEPSDGPDTNRYLTVSLRPPACFQPAFLSGE